MYTLSDCSNSSETQCKTWSKFLCRWSLRELGVVGIYWKEERISHTQVVLALKALMSLNSCNQKLPSHSIFANETRFFKVILQQVIWEQPGNMGTAIDLSQKLGLRLTPRFYYGGGVKCVAEDGKLLIKLENVRWRWLFHQQVVGKKIWFFRPPMMSFAFLDMVFEGKGLEIDTYKPPKCIWSYHTHVVNTRWPKWSRRPKLTFLSNFDVKNSIKSS